MANAASLKELELTIHQRCLFRRVVIYATKVPGSQISNAFGPAISSIRACWGRQVEFYGSVIDSVMLDRWASEIMVAMGEKSRDAQLLFRLDLATNGWQSDGALPPCNCTTMGSGAMQPAKRWIFVKTNKPGNATTLTLKCSWCQLMKSWPKPSHMSSPGYNAGEYYRLVKSNDSTSGNALSN